MNEDINAKRLEVLKKLIKLSIEEPGEQLIMDYMHRLLGHDFIFYNYINDRRVIMGYENDITAQNSTEYEVKLKDDLMGKFVINVPEKEISDFDREVLDYAADILMLIYREKMSVE